LDDPAKDQRAQAQRAADGKQAMADYEAEAAALRAKTERLRALRLAREAAEPPAAPKRAAAKGAGAKGAGAGRTKTAKKGKKQAGASLSQWLADQAKGGRRT
jgi:hypothetical protein